jgi:Flp pilus assembly protein CpaB
MAMPLQRLLHRARLALVCRPIAYWVLAATLALAAAMIVLRSERAASSYRHAWGTTVSVAVATHDLLPGDALATNVVMRALPAAVVPAAALHSLPGAGAVAAATLAQGEIITPAHLAGPGHGPLAQRVPRGSRAVAIPAGDSALPLSAGDEVEIVRTVPAGEGDGPSTVVGRGAVLERSDKAAIVSVPAEEVPAVAAAVADGAAMLALVGPSG